jgi:hypothetical protein
VKLGINDVKLVAYGTVTFIVCRCSIYYIYNTLILQRGYNLQLTGPCEFCVYFIPKK